MDCANSRGQVVRFIVFYSMTHITRRSSSLVSIQSSRRAATRAPPEWHKRLSFFLPFRGLRFVFGDASLSVGESLTQPPDWQSDGGPTKLSDRAPAGQEEHVPVAEPWARQAHYQRTSAEGLHLSDACPGTVVKTWHSEWVPDHKLKSFSLPVLCRASRCLYASGGGCAVGLAWQGPACTRENWLWQDNCICSPTSQRHPRYQHRRSPYVH